MDRHPDLGDPELEAMHNTLGIVLRNNICNPTKQEQIEGHASKLEKIAQTYRELATRAESDSSEQFEELVELAGRTVVAKYREASALLEVLVSTE